MSMHPIRRRKFQVILVLLVMLGITAALVLYALRQNISLFYTPSQVVAGEAPSNRSIRVGGIVVAHSVIRKTGSLQVHFKVTDYEHVVDILYKGVLPDLFREGQGIVAQGVVIDRQHIRASQVLAKHDENYMPPEVKSSLKDQYKEAFH